MTLTQLRAFLLAARSGSFTAAATALAMAQPSVSELVRRLEEEFDLPLFVRAGRRLQLTAAGEELLPFAEQAVTSADSGVEAMRAMRSLGGGTASFGLLKYANYYLLSDLAVQFHTAYPDVRMRLVGQNSSEVAAAVKAGELEAGLIVLPIDTEGLKVTPLLKDEVFYASAEPERLQSTMTISKLAEAPLILYDTHRGTDPTRRQLGERASLEGLRLDPVLELEHIESALSLVARGVGDTVVFAAIARTPALPPNVGLVAFDPPLFDTIALIQRHSTELSPATREMVRLARRALLRKQPPVIARPAMGPIT